MVRAVEVLPSVERYIEHDRLGPGTAVGRAHLVRVRVRVRVRIRVRVRVTVRVKVKVGVRVRGRVRLTWLYSGSECGWQ